MRPLCPLLGMTGTCTEISRCDTASWVRSRSVHVLVHAANVLLQVLANSGELVTRHADHAEVIDLAWTMSIHEHCSGVRRTLPRRRRSNKVKPTTPICSHNINERMLLSRLPYSPSCPTGTRPIRSILWCILPRWPVSVPAKRIAPGKGCSSKSTHGTTCKARCRSVDVCSTKRATVRHPHMSTLRFLFSVMVFVGKCERMRGKERAERVLSRGPTSLVRRVGLAGPMGPPGPTRALHLDLTVE
jgi:hypothetical protein